MTKKTKPGKELELFVADAYRKVGAWKVEHDVDLAGNQIDVYVELMTPGRLLHRIAVEVKDWNSTVGIDVVNRFGNIVKLLHGERLIDEGMIISASGFSRPARKAARTYGIRLLEAADLDAMVGEDEDDGQSAALATLIPQLPSPYFAHPYPLQENFTGRLRERQMLSEWLAGDGQQSFLALTAIGGMGKSALTWAWLHRDVLGLPLSGMAQDPPQAAGRCRVAQADRPEGVLWWSFYDGEASFGTFLDNALIYASDRGTDPRTMPSLHDKVRALVDLLEQRRLLLVLDGFERALRAYASLSAAYRGDDVTADDRSDYRACADPNAANFLRWTAALPLRSRVLLTSRLFPRELDGLAGCRREELDALEPEDGVAFFRAQGVQGTRAEIEAVCEPYGYHPLTLRLLTGMIIRDPTRPRDISVAAEYSLLPNLVSREHHILALAYEALRPSLGEMLSRLAAFRSPVGYEVAAMLSPFAGKRELGLAFSELADRGLIFFDAEHWRYDLHPIVRAYAYDRLAEKEGVHNTLRDYFSAVLVPDVDQVTSIDDLAPLIELYHHTVRAGRYDEAAELFHDRLAEPLHHRLGAYRTEIDLLRALFPQSTAPQAIDSFSEVDPAGNVTLPPLKQAGARAWALSALASAYSCSGQLGRARALLHVHNQLQAGLGDTVQLAIGLQHLARVQLELGELAAAEVSLGRALELGVESGDLGLQATAHQEMGRLLTCQGAFAAARRALDTALEMQAGIGHAQFEGLLWVYRAHHALFTGRPEAAIDAALSALQQAQDAIDAPQLSYPIRNAIWAYWLLGAAQQALGDLLTAEAQLGEALARCREINLVELEPDILLAWARWHLDRGGKDQAKEKAEEALSIADRFHYRLKQAEIRNFLAQWELHGGDIVHAREHAEMARDHAWCDGPPHCYKPALDEAEELLELTNA